MVDLAGGASLGSMVSYRPHRFMQLNLLKSKIHRAEVTDLSLNYEGSLAIDSGLHGAASVSGPTSGFWSAT